MAQARPRLPPGILRQLLARIQPVTASPPAVSLAFIGIAPGGGTFIQTSACVAQT